MIFNSIIHVKSLAPIAGLLLHSVAQRQGSVPSSSSRGASELHHFLVLQFDVTYSWLSALTHAEQVTALSILPMTRADFPAGASACTFWKPICNKSIAPGLLFEVLTFGQDSLVRTGQ